MNDILETKKIKGDLLENKQININGKNIRVINNIFNISNIGLLDVNEDNLKKTEEIDEIWTTISNVGLEKQSNKIIQDYKTRTLLIDNITNLSLKYNINGINIHFNKINDIQSFKRFIIELSPRLREIGIYVNLILTENLNEADYVGIVDFIVEK